MGEGALFTLMLILSCCSSLFGIKDSLAFSVDHDVLQEAIGIVVVPHPDRPRIGLCQLHDLLKYIFDRLCSMSLADDEQRSSTSITVAFRNCLHGRYTEE